MAERVPAGHHPRSKKRLKEGGDCELDLVYYLFRVHHWTPEMYWKMGQGGRDLTYALALQESEDIRERNRRR